MLDLLGLDELTLDAYRLWLRYPELTVEAVAEKLGQPPGAVRRARDRLVELSLLLPSAERPGQMVPVHPEAGLEHLLQAQHEALIRRHERLLRARAQVGTFVSEFLGSRYLDGGPGGEPGEVERISGIDQARAELLALVGRAERQVLSLHTRLGRPAGLTAEILAGQVRALRRGVTMRCVLPRSVRTDEAATGYARTVIENGMEARVAASPPMDVVTVDGRVGLVQLPPGAADVHALVLRSPALTCLATALFEQVWQAAEPFDPGTAAADGAGEGDEGPNDIERMLLRLLSMGVKDEAAARHLGVSVRTVRRMVADLMARLDARSRFQAGTLAAQRGWL